MPLLSKVPKQMRTVPDKFPRDLLNYGKSR